MTIFCTYCLYNQILGGYFESWPQHFFLRAGLDFAHSVLPTFWVMSPRDFGVKWVKNDGIIGPIGIVEVTAGAKMGGRSHPCVLFQWIRVYGHAHDCGMYDWCDRDS